MTEDRDRGRSSATEVLFDGEIEVHYGFIDLIEAGETDRPELRAARAGQLNGICGATEPGFLSLITGLHTGGVAFTMEWHDTEPPIGEDWEEVVEVAYQPPSADLLLSAFEQEEPLRLPTVTSMRARYCATEMDAGHEMDTPADDESGPDRYLLQLWPSPPLPESIPRQTSQIAAYWHREARTPR
ncbi:hypothetical protein [Actinoplanes sp. L3-i22]|uniref:hypothetical protein n=1 Tax=Actinoplanes sp. L3-i22 TaxID=2836373 RepID=UPI001C7938FD|nr:hypothetical protein [Actinoplanes sp. L3-i22]BCY10221.1 hypothetical protein L3i22_053090 [Actinoplanes sp. L3-i22]